MTIAALLLGTAAASVAGDVHKCVDASGKVTFSDTSCPATEKVQPGDTKPGNGSANGARPAAAAAAGKADAASPRTNYGSFLDRGKQAAQDGGKPD